MKYSNEHEARVAAVAHDFPEHEGGDVNGPFGWFAVVELEPGITPADSSLDQPAIDHYQGKTWFLVRENSDGIVTIQAFDSETPAVLLFEQLEDATTLAEHDVTDEQAREAIDGYLQAALFTAVDADGASLDGYGYSFSVAAQAKVRREVIEFISQQIDDVRAFVDTGRPWLQVGIDFSLTRNRHGAGFWDRGAGDVGLRLTEAAHVYGETTVYLADSGELEFS